MPNPAILCLKKGENMTFLKSQISSTLHFMPLNRRCGSFGSFSKHSQFQHFYRLTVEILLFFFIFILSFYHSVKNCFTEKKLTLIILTILWFMLLPGVAKHLVNFVSLYVTNFQEFYCCFCAPLTVKYGRFFTLVLFGHRDAK